MLFKTALIFFAVLIIAFLPVSSFLFFIKNDAFTNYFPPKFFISESLSAGHLPLWNPYINFGFPQYGDMNSGYWSPVTWLLAATVGYNAYSFTIELLLYILLGGLGMYQLTGIWKLNSRVRIIAGIAFMCCGYNIGHLQHFNWISGAAFLPWCMWSYLTLLNKFSLASATRTALLFYLLISSAHPGIIIGSFYFFTGLFIFYIFNGRHAPAKEKYKVPIITHLVLLGLLLILSAGMLTGYLDILPQFIRGEKVSLADSLLAPTNLKSWISALLPFAVVKNDHFFQTDPSMRNCYFSVTLLLFFILAFLNKKNKWQKFLLISGLLFALLAAGGFFKTIAYKFIPLVGYVRLNGEFSIFALCCFILIAAIELDKFIRQKNKFNGKIVWIYYILELLTIGAVMFGLYNATGNQEGLLYVSGIFTQAGLVDKLKTLIDAVGFYDTFWIAGIIQTFFLWGIKWSLKSGNSRLLQQLTIVNLVIMSLLNIPYTGVGKASLSEVQEILNKSPKGIPTPVLQPIAMNDTIPSGETLMIGHWSMYNKQVGVTTEVPYPIILKNMRVYFDSTGGNAGLSFNDRPFMFTLPTDEKDSLKITRFSPAEIHANVQSPKGGRLVLQQNFYPHWYYLDGSGKKEMNREGINFMNIPLEQGKNNIIILFEPQWVLRLMLLSATAFFVCCMALALSWIRSFYLSWHRK